VATKTPREFAARAVNPGFAPAGKASAVTPRIPVAIRQMEGNLCVLLIGRGGRTVENVNPWLANLLSVENDFVGG
jgi:hypothetical protein